MASKSSDHISKLFDNEDLSDVIFLFNPAGAQEMRKLYAHKFILSIHSEVFKRMFSKEWNTGNEIEIQDITYVGFKVMLEYMYNEANVTLRMSYIDEILLASKKYFLTDLENKCNDYIKKNINMTNAIRLYEKLNFSPTFERFCMKYVIANIYRILYNKKLCLQQSFLDCQKSTLAAILNHEESFVTEFELYQLTMDWVTNQCLQQSIECSSKNKRSILGDLFYLIRFPNMSLEEWINKVDGELFTIDDINSLFMYFSMKKTEQLKFPVVKRKIQYNIDFTRGTSTSKSKWELDSYQRSQRLKPLANHHSVSPFGKILWNKPCGYPK